MVSAISDTMFCISADCRCFSLKFSQTFCITFPICCSEFVRAWADFVSVTGGALSEGFQSMGLRPLWLPLQKGRVNSDVLAALAIPDD